MGPRALRQRSRILAAIEGKAMTGREIADTVHMSRDNVYFYIAGLKADKAIHIESFVCNHQGGRAAPRWRAGDMPNAVYVKTRASRGDVPAMRRTQIKKELRCRTLSVNELAERLHLHPAYVRRKIRDLRNDKEVRIAGWGKPNAGGFLPLYGLGNAPDMPKNPANPLKRHQEYRERHKDRLNETRRLRDRLRKKPNNWASILGL